MTNQQILDERWKNIDKYLLQYQKNYKKVNRKMRDRIQDVFNLFSISYSEVNKPVSRSEKDRFDRFILELKEKGLLTGYFGYNARLLYARKSITYSEMLEVMIAACYIKQNKELDEYNNLLFYNSCKDSYEKGIKDIGKTKKIKPISFKMPILYTLLNIPILNATAEEYLSSLTLSNAQELYKQTLVNLQLNKELNVDNKNYKNLFLKQDNRFISVNDNKMSGGIVNITENLTNLAYLQAGKDTNTKECRFIAEIDKRTTEMCETLNNQIFKVNDMNVYQRYSETDKRIVTYHTQGLVQGENLPPINNHFHWCRSTITYQIEMSREELNKNLMTTKEQDAIQRWESFDFYKINKKMYTKQKLSVEEKQLIKDLYKALNKVPYYEAKEDQYILRTLLINDENKMQKIIEQHPIGGVYESLSYEAYSIKKGYHDNPNVYFYIRGSKKARNMLEYNSVDGNVEVLYQYGTKFKTLNYQKINGKHYFLMEEYDE